MKKIQINVNNRYNVVWQQSIICVCLFTKEGIYVQYCLFTKDRVVGCNNLIQ